MSNYAVKIWAKTSFGSLEVGFDLARPDLELCEKVFNTFRNEASYSEFATLISMPDGAKLIKMEVRICKGRKILQRKTVANTDVKESKKA